MPSPKLTPSPSPTATLLNLSSYIDKSGVVNLDMDLTFSNGLVKIKIPKGAMALTADGIPLNTIQVQSAEQLPVPPSNCQIVGLAYDLGPHGATFAPYITLTLGYDPGLCPKGTSQQNLVIAYFDVETGKWVNLQCAVDTTNHLITAEVQHLTVFAIVAEAGPRSPSTIGVSWSLTSGIIGGLAVLALVWQRRLLRLPRTGREWYWNGTVWVPPNRHSGREWYWDGDKWVPPGK
jgi:hypothetical protein